MSDLEYRLGKFIDTHKYLANSVVSAKELSVKSTKLNALTVLESLFVSLTAEVSGISELDGKGGDNQYFYLLGKVCAITEAMKDSIFLLKDEYGLEAEGSEKLDTLLSWLNLITDLVEKETTV